MRRTMAAAIGLTVVAGAGVVAVTATSGSAGTGPSPDFSTANFHNPTTNRFFPLAPGLVLRYQGSEDGVHYREVVRVTKLTKTIQGVKATVIHDVLRRADGTLAEKTTDWYAADHAGNVWYLGENTATYRPNGTVESREGSWQAGVAGGVPGIIMPANPSVTDAYRQEFRKGHAEDQAWIVQAGLTVRVPHKKLSHVIRSFEWTRLEPDVISMKLYAPGLGIVKERDVAGGNERFVLVAASRG